MSDPVSRGWNPKVSGPPAGPSVLRLLLAWQDTGSQQVFETLVINVLGDIEDTARRVLAGANIRSGVAVDEVVSLVLDHLRRLRPVGKDARGVRPFDPSRLGKIASDGDTEAGCAYIRWLSHRRALDICRTYRRRNKYEAAFAELPAATISKIVHKSIAAEHCSEEERERNEQWLDEALSVLDNRSRQVLVLLRAGQSQAEIARKLGIHEGTISRIRMRAIDTLRQKLAGRDGPGSPHPARQSRRSPR